MVTLHSFERLDAFLVCVCTTVDVLSQLLMDIWVVATVWLV